MREIAEQSSPPRPRAGAHKNGGKMRAFLNR